MEMTDTEPGGRYLSDEAKRQWRRQRQQRRRTRRRRRLLAGAGLLLGNALLIAMADRGHIDPRFAIAFAAGVSVILTCQIKY